EAPRPMKVVDVHCHIVPADFPAAPPTCAPEKWPRMEDRGNGQRAMMTGKREMRVVDNRAWEAARRIADMNGEDVGMQAISPMPEILSYWIDAQSALTMARYMNRTIADIVHAAPERFVGLGMVPLQDPQLAAKELAALRGDGLVGVEIGSNITGKSPGDPFFDPFYAEAERQDLAIFVHALHPTMTDRLVGPPMVAPYVAFPTDIGLAGASLITGRGSAEALLRQRRLRQAAAALSDRGLWRHAGLRRLGLSFHRRPEKFGGDVRRDRTVAGAARAAARRQRGQVLEFAKRQEGVTVREA